MRHHDREIVFKYLFNWDRIHLSWARSDFVLHVRNQRKQKNFHLTSIGGFAFGCEDDKSKTLSFFAMERDVKRLVVQGAGHWYAR